MSFWLYQGDCVEVMKGFPPESIDAVVTDPPYDLTAHKKGGSGVASLNLKHPAGRSRITTGFQGKSWDATGVAFDPATWREVLRLARPGAHLLAFGGARTFHRLTCAIEDAGFEIRDCLTWLYGSGYPAALSLGGGWATRLKPAWEPVVLARKPMVGNTASNIAVHGVGALNVDACRLGRDEELSPASRENQRVPGALNFMPGSGPRGGSALGRWPANVVLDDESGALLDEAVGEAGAKAPVTGDEPSVANEGVVQNPRGRVPGKFHNDKGGPSRFFYSAKVSRGERDFGCEHLPEHTGGEAVDREDGAPGALDPRAGAGRTGGVRNRHPTLKPVSLLRWLTKLVTPKGGTVLDCFAGAGSTGMACRLEGFRFVGIEKEEEYLTYAQARISAVEQGKWVEK